MWGKQIPHFIRVVICCYPALSDQLKYWTILFSNSVRKILSFKDGNDPFLGNSPNLSWQTGTGCGTLSGGANVTVKVTIVARVHSGFLSGWPSEISDIGLNGGFQYFPSPAIVFWELFQCWISVGLLIDQDSICTSIEREGYAMTTSCGDDDDVAGIHSYIGR